MGIFKGKIDLQKTIDSVTGIVDKSFMTDQEKSEHFIKLADKTVDFYGKTLEENTTRSKTRRAVAYIVVGLIVFEVLLCTILSILGKPIDDILEIAITFNLPVAFITVLAFFFGGYYFKNIRMRSDKIKGK